MEPFLQVGPTLGDKLRFSISRAPANSASTPQRLLAGRSSTPVIARIRFPPDIRSSFDIAAVAAANWVKNWVQGTEMADSSLLMPAADDAYRRSRDRLRAAEIDLRDRIEAVAAMRRELPPGPVVPDYTFIENGSRVQLSELFAADKPHLIVYHLMYWAKDDSFCPSCSMWIDGFNGIAPHVTQQMNFVIASRAPIDKLREWAAHREWHRLRLALRRRTSFRTRHWGRRCRGQSRFDCRRLRERGRPYTSRLHRAPGTGGPRARHRFAHSGIRSSRSHAGRPR